MPRSNRGERCCQTVLVRERSAKHPPRLPATGQRTRNDGKSSNRCHVERSESHLLLFASRARRWCKEIQRVPEQPICNRQGQAQSKRCLDFARHDKRLYFRGREIADATCCIAAEKNREE